MGSQGKRAPHGPARAKAYGGSIYAIVIYNKKYIFFLSPVPGPKPLKPLEFLVRRGMNMSFVMLIDDS